MGQAVTLQAEGTDTAEFARPPSGLDVPLTAAPSRPASPGPGWAGRDVLRGGLHLLRPSELFGTYRSQRLGGSALDELGSLWVFAGPNGGYFEVDAFAFDGRPGRARSDGGEHIDEELRKRGLEPTLRATVVPTHRGPRQAELALDLAAVPRPRSHSPPRGADVALAS